MSSDCITQFWLILESIRFDVFENANIPIMKGMGHLDKAYAHGRWTRPAIVSLFSGYLPRSSYYKNLYTPSWVYFGFDDLKTLFINSNAWVKNMNPRRYDEVFLDNPSPTYSPFEDAKRTIKDNKEGYKRVVLFAQETHVPYTYKDEKVRRRTMDDIDSFNQRGSDDMEIPKQCIKLQTETLEYLDIMFKGIVGILEQENMLFIIVSDHGELFGEHHCIGHDPSMPFDMKLLEVPLIVART